MSDIRVVNEGRTYSALSSNSFFRDQQRALALADPHAQARLMRHLREVAVEVQSDSVEGRSAVREYSERLRDDSRYDSASSVQRAVREEVGRVAHFNEYRAATTSTISGFSTPQWIIDEFSIFRGTQRTFADQCINLPIPDVGMQINVPQFTSTASAGVRAEGAAVSSIEADPSGTDQSERVQTIAGQIITSQQLLDRTRGTPDGTTFDFVVINQLKSAYDQALNNYVLGKVMGLAAQVTGQTTWSLANLYQDLAVAREQLQDTAGTRLMPTHVFTTPDLYSYTTRQVDDQHRPLVIPGYAPGRPLWPEEDGHDDRWTQFTGTVLPGLLMWFVDATIPPSGSNTQIVVSRPETVLVWEGDVTTRVYQETIANQLQVVTQLYAYAACVPRFPHGTAVITSNAYPTSNV